MFLAFAILDITDRLASLGSSFESAKQKRKKKTIVSHVSVALGPISFQLARVVVTMSKHLIGYQQ